MEPATPIDTLCRIIIRAREYEAQIPTDYGSDESADNIDGDDDDEAFSVLDDDINTSVEEELSGVIEDLADDQQAEVLAFVMVGRGDYDASEWKDALETAAEESDIVETLLETPMLASMLEQGMAAFDLDCDNVGSVT
ncbi:DUF3775 domain-containing protein [Sphingomicrobium astaxanthinifaciens]|uniref:DUF3775 domain-containing protein n=1 Tax=Sphingomicrobium astaxanthinifaciens TaxID=1227949 RepID=UPI001FCB6C95|nr:DUF3775 domain-containing protein [Sphingomicrobium astaxanthinifaciens]MCJ7420251.1 DUF3775 domain-containing protein [Sphingomicrobium astaxanthinifaciens]